LAQRGNGDIGEILSEVYKAVANDQYRLAAMGIRAALEQVMIGKVGDLPTFDQKLDAFQDRGYISAVQRDAMRSTLDVGDAAMHRGHRPTEDDLDVALDIVEGVFAPIFVQNLPMVFLPGRRAKGEVTPLASCNVSLKRAASRIRLADRSTG
jgi:hypothetical protein